MPDKPKSAKGTTTKAAGRFTAEERDAMKERARELKKGDGDAEREVLEKIAEMPEPDRSMAGKIHAIVTASAPELTPRLWYGMPAYAKDGKVLCHFQPAKKFKTRYPTLGFSDEARLDEGNMWPVAYGLSKLTAADEKKIAALVKKAVG